MGRPATAALENALLLCAVVDLLLFFSAAGVNVHYADIAWRVLRIALSLSFCLCGARSDAAGAHRSVRWPRRILPAAGGGTRIGGALAIAAVVLIAFSSPAKADGGLISGPTLSLAGIWSTIQTIIGILDLVWTVIHGVAIAIVIITKFTLCWLLAFLIGVVIFINVFDAFGLVAKDFSFTRYITNVFLVMLQCEPVDPEFGEYRAELFRAYDERRKRSDTTMSAMRAALMAEHNETAAVDRPPALYAKGTLAYDISAVITLLEATSDYLEGLGKPIIV